MKKISALLLALSLLASVSCTALSKSVAYKRYTSPPVSVTRVHQISSHRSGEGAITVQIEPAKKCVTTVTTQTTTTSKHLRKGYVFFSLLGLGVASYLVASLKPVPAEERVFFDPSFCNQDPITICDLYFKAKDKEKQDRQTISYYQGGMLLLDLLALRRLGKAMSEVSSFQPHVSSQTKQDESCQETCNLVGKDAYLRVILDDHPWCLELGRISAEHRVEIPADFQAQQARRLPAKAREELLSDAPDALFYTGRITVPECGERHDCEFWVTR